MMFAAKMVPELHSREIRSIDFVLFAKNLDLVIDRFLKFNCCRLGQYYCDLLTIIILCWAVRLLLWTMFESLILIGSFGCGDWPINNLALSPLRITLSFVVKWSKRECRNISTYRSFWIHDCKIRTIISHSWCQQAGIIQRESDVTKWWLFYWASNYGVQVRE